jgi:hypothetical protein
MPTDPDRPIRRKASLLDTVKAVGASFFGVRGGKAHERDIANLNPVHLIVVGILLAAVFVVTLLLIVRAVV